MNKFIVNIVVFFSLILTISLIRPLWGLYRLHNSYYYPHNMAIKLISGRTDFNRKILVIGCSNLRHNIDFDKVRDSIKAGIDFLIFSGSENSTYLKFLVDENETSAYTDIVLYVPYHILQENSFLVKNDYNYRELGCFKYSIDIIKKRGQNNKIYGRKKNFRRVNMRNEPFLMDSIFFYDQWYHLNHCGKEIESNNMIKSLKKVFN